MELMEMNLLRYLEENVHESQSGPPLPLLLALDIMLQLAEAMNYLHKSEVMHCDLKPINVLINVVENESYIFPSVRVKLTDFGISKLNLNNSRLATREVGTAKWRAPEVFPFGPRNKYTKAADVYSYAMVFFEVLTGRCHSKT
jgi:serine/threonine protein kinase